MRPLDYQAICNVVAALGSLVDHRDWPGLKALFAADVLVDYTSLFGGEPTSQSGAALVDGWAAFLPANFHATEHLIGVPLVEVAGGHATARAAVTAWHWKDDALAGPSERWVVGGHYHFDLVRNDERWLISAMRLEARWQEGRPPSA